MQSVMGFTLLFMPKPKAGINGSGMHINMSLADQSGHNVFIDETDGLGLSRIAYQFMAGILAHMKEITMLTNPLVNSYKRLVPGYDAPVYVTWSAAANRSALIRIPCTRGSNTRIELRCPDSAVNPYLALAACLAAGLDGIKQEMEPPKSVDVNLFAMTEEQMDALGIEQLPETLGEALEAFEHSSFVRKVLGDHVYTKYLAAKSAEWKKFRAEVTDWEVEEYLYKF